MLTTMTGLLLVTAFVLTMLHAATGRVPLWVAVLLIDLALLLSVVPLGR